MKTNGRLSTGYLVQGGRTLFEIVTGKVQKSGSISLGCTLFTCQKKPVKCQHVFLGCFNHSHFA